MRCDPARLQRRQAGHAGGEDRRLRVVGPAEYVVGPVPAQPRQREAQDLISAKKDLAGLGRRRGHLLAHPSVLGTLPWKDECDRHRSQTAEPLDPRSWIRDRDYCSTWASSTAARKIPT